MSWELVSQSDNAETRTGEDGSTIEIRDAKEFVRKKSVTSYENTDAAGTTAGVLSFKWNGSTNTKSLTAPKKFLCISDTISRIDIPGNGGERVQVWVHYSAWSPTSEFGA